MSVCGRAELIIGWEKSWEENKTGGSTSYKEKNVLESIFYTSIACWLLALESLIKEPVEMLETFYINRPCNVGKEREMLASSRQIG